MRVTLEVVGDDEYEFDVESATYAELLGEVGLSPNEVAVLVDGRPVPEDQPVEARRARVLRLVSGGSAAARSRWTGPRRVTGAAPRTSAPPRRRRPGTSRTPPRG